MFNKDVTRAKVICNNTNSFIVLLDASLEYRKPEATTNVDIIEEQDWMRLLESKEEYITEL